MYKAYIIALPTPSSARDNIDRILVNKPLIPKYSVAKHFINIVLLIKPNIVCTICPKNPVVIFLIELIVLDLLLISNSFL